MLNNIAVVPILGSVVPLRTEGGLREYKKDLRGLLLTFAFHESIFIIANIYFTKGMLI